MRTLTSFVILAGAAFLPIQSPGRTWSVFQDGSGEAPTIQAGIDSAVVGDTVLVQPGTYNETVTFRGVDIVLQSAAGPASTILDADGLNGRVVTFKSGETRAATIEGFTLTHGVGGIIILNSSPSILGNIIVENSSVPGDGGGIWCSASTFYPWFPLIQGNTIVGNRGANLAGGIGFGQRMVPDIIDNYIAGNEARDGDGGGIYYRSFDNGAVIRGNLVVNNRAGDHGGGIYVALVNAPPPSLQVEISWNLVANNIAPGSSVTGISGGGIHLIETDAWVHHNTIVCNEGGSTSSTLGGGIGVERLGSPLIEKNIIAFTAQGGGINCVGGATPIIRNNLAWQNVGGDGVGDCPTWWQSDGNVVADPYFCNPESSDYSLAQNSPALTHPAGPLGAFHLPGCGPVSVEPITWGRIKAMYGN
jgi:hypothetical protein